ncbi:MAG: isoprenylcysteine carboxylmethyltransferase family protein [Chitinophagaceae bacterium]|nr:isoprenylcysteine carboxylmethyltransferase family protein [Chitinophagaceae bacterium]
MTLSDASMMLSLFLRNLFFTILQPGIVAGLIPLWIVSGNVSLLPLNMSGIHHYAGIILFTIGVGILFSCIISFARKGRGTLSPVDPTKKLVVEGLYRFSRNPMYVGVLMILIGEAVYFQSAYLSAYTVIIFLAFNVFIRLHEEPRLLRDFGVEYQQYCKKVRRWI